MAAGSVVIGPEFFAKVKLDYSDWRTALCRELWQNSTDANGCSNIYISIGTHNDDTKLVWRNDGVPMSRDELVDKFLALGGSGKSFQNGKVGGFGAAKLLIAFCHRSYQIRTGTLRVTGSGASYDLETDLPYFHGTETTVVIHGAEDEGLLMACRRFIGLCQWRSSASVNGDLVAADLHKGARRKDFSWGTVYTNKSHAGLLVVRTNGVMTFTKPVRYKETVLVELTRASGDILTTNRDGLKWQWQSELDSFIAEIAVNTRSAFKDRKKKAEKVRFAGYKLAGSCEDTEAELGEAIKVDLPRHFDAALVSNVACATRTGDAPVISEEQVRAVLRPEFFLKSEIGGRIPSWFLPGSFSENSKRLISNWIALLVELATGL